MATPDYLDHFRLRSAPFGAAPDGALFYGHGARTELLGALAYAVTHGDGIVKITGDAGSGMTMLCHALARQLAGQSVIVHMEPASLGPLGVIHATALALGVNPDGKRSDEVLRELQTRLMAMRAGGRHAVLMADHADMLPAEALEEIRLLTNLDDTSGKLLQIVLLGQHALNTSLKQASMRQVRERITLSFVMPPLASEDVQALLAHRLRAVGYEGLDMFASDAARLLASTAKADLRRLIHLADQALAAAASEGAVAITTRHVQAAIRGRLPALRPRGKARPVALAAIGGALVLALGLGAAFVYQATPRRATAASLPMSNGVMNKGVISGGTINGGVMNGGAMNGGVTNSGVIKPAAPVAVGTAPVPDASASVPKDAADAAASAVPAVTATTVTTNPAPTAPASAVTMAHAGTPSTAASATSASGTPAAQASSSGVAKPAASAVSEASGASAKSAATAYAAGLSASPPAASLLQQTLKAGKTWLRDEADSHYSIKIEDIPARDTARAEAFLAEVRGAIGLGDVHAYPTLNKGERRVGIAYGSFTSEQQARKAMAAFKGRWSYPPKIRKISEIRAAVARAGQAR